MVALEPAAHRSTTPRCCKAPKATACMSARPTHRRGRPLLTSVRKRSLHRPPRLDRVVVPDSISTSLQRTAVAVGDGRSSASPGAPGRSAGRRPQAAPRRASACPRPCSRLRRRASRRRAGRAWRPRRRRRGSPCGCRSARRAAPRGIEIDQLQPDQVIRLVHRRVATARSRSSGRTA